MPLAVFTTEASIYMLCVFVCVQARAQSVSFTLSMYAWSVELLMFVSLVGVADIGALYTCYIVSRWPTLLYIVIMVLRL